MKYSKPRHIFTYTKIWLAIISITDLVNILLNLKIPFIGIILRLSVIIVFLMMIYYIIASPDWD